VCPLARRPSARQDVLSSCLTCATAPNAGWCASVCAANAGSNLDAFTRCSACGRAANPWDCGTCFASAGGVAAKRDGCLACVGSKLDAYGCSECAKKPTACEAQKCTDCMRASPGNAWACYSASYAAACVGGRRLL
jgi:hypothetical protein